jgi:hypothetical protein
MNGDNQGVMKKRAILTSAFLAAVLGASPAHSCSVVAGYKVPTALELAASAEAIVLARVGDAHPGKDKYSMGSVQIVPETLLYGSTLPKELALEGSLDSDRARATDSDPNELAQANPDAFWGGCNRYVFRKGMLLLLFLEREKDGSLGIISWPFARTLEDVPDESAPWVRAVRFYASIARDPKDVRKQKMATERDRLLATRDPVDALLAKDIAREMKGKRTQNYD